MIIIATERYEIDDLTAFIRSELLEIGKLANARKNVAAKIAVALHKNSDFKNPLVEAENNMAATNAPTRSVSTLKSVLRILILQE